MCLKDNVEHHWSEMERKQATLAEALSWSASGRNLQKMSTLFVATDVMQLVKAALGNESGNSIDRFKMAQYLALALENDPEYNIERFIAYLDMISEQASCERRGEYYKLVRDAIVALNQSKELRFYMAVYEQFKADTSKEARLAREIMTEIAENTSHLMGEYS